MNRVTKIIVMLLATLLLASCGQTFNQNIHKQYAKDTEKMLQSIDDITSSADGYDDLQGGDLDIVLDYVEEHHSKVYDGDEEELYQLTYQMVKDLGEYFTDKDKFKKDKKKVESILYE